MRDLFPDFYKPSEGVLANAWAEGVFVLDANVLLQMFEVSPETRDDFLRLLERLGNQIFVPHYAALEYQRNRQSAAPNFEMPNLASLSIWRTATSRTCSRNRTLI